VNDDPLPSLSFHEHTNRASIRSILDESLDATVMHVEDHKILELEQPTFESEMTSIETYILDGLIQDALKKTEALLLATKTDAKNL
jgi:hypothetical protein